MVIDQTILRDAESLWDYHRLGMALEQADAIVGLGSYDPRVAEHASDLFLGDWGQWLLFTGGIVARNDLLKTPWDGAEADVFGAIATARGVPRQRLLLEDRATNTSENLRYSWEILARSEIGAQRLIIVTKPNMERRVRATARVVLPSHISFVVTSSPSTFEEECLSRFDPVVLINLLVGDLQRIEVYPTFGFQASERIPEHVRDACRRLIASGFTKHLIRDQDRPLAG